MQDEKKNKKFTKTKIQELAIGVLIGFATYIMLFGGSRSGKTFILLYAIVVRALKTKSRHLILRKHFNHVKTSVWMDTLPKVFDICWPGLKQRCTWSQTDFFITLPNKSEIWVAGLDDKERVEKILGKEYSTIYFNETSQIDYNSQSVAITRLAEKNSLVKKVYYDMNPPGKSHWTYWMWIKKVRKKDKKKLDSGDYDSLLMNPLDNVNNIDGGYLKILENMTEKDRRRFKDGKFSDDDEGLLFKDEYIQRVYELPEFDRIVVSIDPAVTSNPDSNETGITVEARKGDFGYVLEDRSGVYKPSAWAKVAIELYFKWGADRIIGEVNNGGELIEAVLRNENPNIPYKSVHASRGKIKRAEPIAALYEQNKIFHYGVLSELEEQMAGFETIEKKGEDSPDRVDSLVWGFSELFELNMVVPRISSI